MSTGTRPMASLRRSKWALPAISVVIGLVYLGAGSPPSRTSAIWQPSSAGRQLQREVPSNTMATSKSTNW